MSNIPNIIPISDLRQNAAEMIRRITTSREPVFITQRGRAAAVLVSMDAYREDQQELMILRELARGQKEMDTGKGHTLHEVLQDADRLVGTGDP